MIEARLNEVTMLKNRRGLDILDRQNGEVAILGLSAINPSRDLSTAFHKPTISRTGIFPLINANANPSVVTRASSG